MLVKVSGMMKWILVISQCKHDIERDLENNQASSNLISMRLGLSYNVKLDQKQMRLPVLALTRPVRLLMRRGIHSDGCISKKFLQAVRNRCYRTPSRATCAHLSEKLMDRVVMFSF